MDSKTDIFILTFYLGQHCFKFVYVTLNLLINNHFKINYLGFEYYCPFYASTR